MSTANGHAPDLAAIAALARLRAQGGDDDHAALVDRAYRTMRARDEARARLDAERGRGGLDSLPMPVSLADALAQPDPPVRYRIDRLLPAEGNATLVAPRKVGKTTTVVNLVRSLADGVPFLGEFAVQRPAGRIAVLNYEVSHAQLVRWYRDVPITDPGRVELITLRGHRLPLLTDPGQQWLATRLRDAGVEVAVVDPFGAAFRSAGGLDENSNSEVGRFLTALDEVKLAAGVAELVMPVHGARDAAEGRERARGASALEDWPDAIWRLASDDGGGRFLSALGRDVDEPERRLAYDGATRLLSVDGASRAQQRRADARGAVVQALAAGEHSRNALETDLVRGDGPVARADLVEALRGLVADGAVRERQGPRNARLYSLTSPLR